MKKALLLHGWEADSQSNWLPWLKTQLETKWYKVFVPNLPESHSPILEDHLATIKDIASDFGKDDVIIGHSMWGKLAMHCIDENDLKNIHCILVWPTYDTIEDEIDLDDPEDVKKNLIHYNEAVVNFDKINENKNNFVLLISLDDPFIPVKSVKKYFSQLQNISTKEFPKAGHFCWRDGFIKFEEILDYIK